MRHLELLKKRFGDAALASCEVMLRDVDESRRITKQIHQVHNHHHNNSNHEEENPVIMSMSTYESRHNEHE